MIAIAIRLNDPKYAATKTATIIAPSAPAIAPDQVFFGLIAGSNFGPPKARPAKYPRTSVVHTTANNSTIARNP